MGFNMRGLGKTQADTSAKNKFKVLLEIAVISKGSFPQRFATQSDIYKRTKINKKSIRNHISTLLKDKMIFEETILHNNTRGFIIAEEHKNLKIKMNLLEWSERLRNTNDYIHELKFNKNKK